MFSMIYELLEKLVNRVISTIKKVNGVSAKPDGDITYKAINLLDNSNFADPINQNGSTIYSKPTSNSGSIATIDRWRFMHREASIGNWSKIYMEVKDGYIHFENLDDHLNLDGGRNSIYQITTNTIKLGTKVTFAVKTLDGDIHLVSGDPSTGLIKSDMLYVATINSVPYTDLTHLQASITYSGDYVWAALYEGEYTLETLPTYTPKTYVEELMECHKYYFKKTYRNLVCSCLSTTELSFTIDLGATPMSSEPDMVWIEFLDASVEQITFTTDGKDYTIDLSGTRTCTIENYVEGATTLQIKLTSSIAMSSSIVNRVGYIDGLTFVLNCEG